MSDISPLEEAIDAWLQAKHCTLWAHFDIQSRQGRADAVAFILGLLEDLSEIAIVQIAYPKGVVAAPWKPLHPPLTSSP